jgi:hypothetical protein
MAENSKNPIVKNEYLQESLGFYNLVHGEKESSVNLKKILSTKI